MREIKRCKIRTRCRLCERYRYINFMIPSISEKGKWFCKDYTSCIETKKYKDKLKKCII